MAKLKAQGIPQYKLLLTTSVTSTIILSLNQKQWRVKTKGRSLCIMKGEVVPNSF